MGFGVYPVDEHDGQPPAPRSSKYGTYKTVKAIYKTVKATYKTVKATYKTVKVLYKTVKATYKTVKVPAGHRSRAHHQLGAAHGPAPPPPSSLLSLQVLEGP